MCPQSQPVATTFSADPLDCLVGWGRIRIPRMLDNFGECLHAENGLDPLVRALLTTIGGGNLASSRSSGAAERYQYVLPGSTWPSGR